MNPSDQDPGQVQSIGARTRRWLEREVHRWAGGGLIEESQARAILGCYPDTDALKRRSGTRIFFTICSLGFVMVFVGVLLLIGFNWQDMTRSLKIGVVFSFVVTTFAGSAAAYAYSRPILGELLAFFGTLMYGSAIWLLAQVYHIQYHWPDGVLWWLIGTLLTAHLLKSRLVGVAAAVLLCVWVFPEVLDFQDPSYMYLVLAAATVWLGYRLRSPALVFLTLVATFFWTVAVAVEPWELEKIAVPLVLLLGCAYYAVGAFQVENTSMARVWQVCGLAGALVILMPMTFTEFHDHFDGVLSADEVYLPLTAAVLLAAVVVARFLRVGDRLSDWPLGLTALAAAVGLFVETPELIGALIYSVVSVVVGIWLIVRGVRLDRALSFFAGVTYILVFVVVRYFDLMDESMLKTSILFFVAGAVFFVTALFWRRREPVALPTVATVEGEVNHEQ